MGKGGSTYNYSELYCIALDGLYSCYHGLEQHLSVYESGISTKDIGKVKKSARDIEVLLRCQNQFFNVLDIQNRLIINDAPRKNSSGILASIIKMRAEDIEDREKGLKILDSIIVKHTGIGNEIMGDRFAEFVEELKADLDKEYMKLIQFALLLVLNKSYREIGGDYENFNRKLLSATKKARRVFGEANGIYPMEYTNEINPDDIKNGVDDALRIYIRENIDPYTHRAYG